MGHLQILSFIGVVTSFWQVLHDQLLARLSLFSKYFDLKRSLQYWDCSFFIINNFNVMMENSSEISIESLISHN